MPHLRQANPRMRHGVRYYLAKTALCSAIRAMADEVQPSRDDAGPACQRSNRGERLFPTEVALDASVRPLLNASFPIATSFVLHTAEARPDFGRCLPNGDAFAISSFDQAT
jgi:hypothetical protein